MKVATWMNMAEFGKRVGKAIGMWMTTVPTTSLLAHKNHTGEAAGWLEHYEESRDRKSVV